jgi:hypothetical protein
VSFWQSIKSKSILMRLEDEAIHAVALEQFRSGELRTGLWAKALIEARGDQSIAEAAYLRLLVAALKDEMHVAAKFSEDRTVPTRNQQQKPAAAALSAPDRMALEQRGYALAIIRGTADYRACDAVVRRAGGSLESVGFWRDKYVVKLNGQQHKFDDFDKLVQWITTNLPVQEWADSAS